MPLRARGFWAALVAAVIFCSAPAGAAAPAGGAVRFTTSDGVVLAGTVFGDGAVGVVLAHMFPTDQTSWQPFARQLAAEGYRALAFDFRGFGRSGGSRRVDEIDLDVRAAAAYLRSQGARRIVLVGASMGGTASIKAATPGGVDALIAISSPMRFRGLNVSETELTRLTMPSLWSTSDRDSVTPAMRAMHAAAGGRKALHVYSGSAHGTYIFDSAHGPDLTGRILVFIARAVPPR